MSGFPISVLVVAMLLASFVWADANPGRRVDATQRQDDLANRRVPLKTLDTQQNAAISEKSFPIKKWHGEYNSLGQRRSTIEVRERREKTMIRPNLVEVEKHDRKISPQSGRLAHVRNFDQVRENQLVPRYRDAGVATVQQMSRPAPSAKKEEEGMTMREINRFSFQRNHPDTGGPKVDRAGSAEKE